MAKPSYRNLLEKALEAGAARRYDEAEELLTRIAAECESLPEAWLYLGRALHARGEPGRAVAAIRAYLERAPEAASGWFYLGRSLASLALYRDALKAFARAQALGYARAELLALSGLCHLRLKRSDKAVQALERAVAAAPDDARVFNAYLNALFIHAARILRRGEADMARQMLSFAIERGLDGPAARLYRSRAFRALGRIDEAIADADDALRAAPDDRQLAIQAAALRLAAGRGAEALELLRSNGAALPGPEGAPWSEEQLERWRAAEALAAGDARAALEAAMARLRKGDADPAMRAIAAQANYELGRYDRSANFWKLAAEGDPGSADFRLGLALALWELGDQAGARAAAKAAAARGASPEDHEYLTLLCDAKAGARPEALLPKAQALLRMRGADPKLMFILAECQYKLGMPELAEGWLGRVLDAEPTHELALLYFISSAESQGHDDEALARYGRYLGLFPDNGAVRRDYANALMAKRRWAEAASAIEEGFAYGQAGTGAEAALALCLRNAGRFREAAARYRLLLKAEPKNAELLLGLAYSLHRSGAKAMATELLERGAAYIRADPEPYLALGALRYREKSVEKAVEAFTKAAELAPADPRPLRNLARIYEKSGVRELAAKYRDLAARLSQR